MLPDSVDGSESVADVASADRAIELVVDLFILGMSNSLSGASFLVSFARFFGHRLTALQA